MDTLQSEIKKRKMVTEVADAEAKASPQQAAELYDDLEDMLHFAKGIALAC